MALTASGQLSLGDIATEMGASLADVSLTTQSTTGINEASPLFPDLEKPHAISEFYGYDHNYSAGPAAPFTTFNAESSSFTTLQTSVISTLGAPITLLLSSGSNRHALYTERNSSGTAFNIGAFEFGDAGELISTSSKLEINNNIAVSQIVSLGSGSAYAAIYRDQDAGGDLYGRVFTYDSTTGTLANSFGPSAIFTSTTNVSPLDSIPIASNKFAYISGRGGTGYWIGTVTHNGAGGLTDVRQQYSMQVSIGPSAAKLFPTSSDGGFAIIAGRPSSGGNNQTIQYIEYQDLATTPSYGGSRTTIINYGSKALTSVGAKHFGNGYGVFFYCPSALGAENVYWSSIHAQTGSIAVLNNYSSSATYTADSYRSTNTTEVLWEDGNTIYFLMSVGGYWAGFAKCDITTGAITLLEEQSNWLSSDATQHSVLRVGDTNTDKFMVVELDRNTSEMVHITGSIS